MRSLLESSTAHSTRRRVVTDTGYIRYGYYDREKKTVFTRRRSLRERQLNDNASVITNVLSSISFVDKFNYGAKSLTVPRVSTIRLSLPLTLIVGAVDWSNRVTARFVYS